MAGAHGAGTAIWVFRYWACTSCWWHILADLIGGASRGAVCDGFGLDGSRIMPSTSYVEFSVN